jgi:hypothetical protein
MFPEKRSALCESSSAARLRPSESASGWFRAMSEGFFTGVGLTFSKKRTGRDA